MTPEEFYAELAAYLHEQYDDIDVGYYKFTVEVVKGNDSEGCPYILFSTQSLNSMTKEEVEITRAYVERLMKNGDLN